MVWAVAAVFLVLYSAIVFALGALFRVGGRG